MPKRLVTSNLLEISSWIFMSLAVCVFHRQRQKRKFDANIGSLVPSNELLNFFYVSINTVESGLDLMRKWAIPVASGRFIQLADSYMQDKN